MPRTVYGTVHLIHSIGFVWVLSLTVKGWAIFTFGGRGPAITAHGSLDLKPEIQIQSAGVNYLNIFESRVQLDSIGFCRLERRG
jgi:hypothetical protein